jgi:predicted  nucleic acid-binding Zn-ribbon protein
LHHSHLDDRTRSITAEIARLEARLASDPEADRVRHELAEAKALQQEVGRRLRDRDREREDHRIKMRARERELMSGRVRNPTELMQLSAEVDHMKARLADEEDAELELMEESERAEEEVRRLEQVLTGVEREREAETPELTAALERSRQQLAAAEREREEVWSQVPPAYQSEYRRLRVQPPVAEVVNGQCSGCHVAVTSKQMQLLRRGDSIVHCDNCGRILVVA